MRQKRNLARFFLILSVIAWAAICIVLLTPSAKADVSLDDGSLPGDDIPAIERCYMTAEEVREDFENQKIEDALLARSHVIEGCTVTWYTADTCGKKPGDPGYGITASGLPVVEHLTCAVDTSVIPLYADVFVQYADGTIEQLWATDTGVRGDAIDIYTPDHDHAIQCGRQTLTVWWVAPE